MVDFLFLKWEIHKLFLTDIQPLDCWCLFVVAQFDEITSENWMIFSKFMISAKPLSFDHFSVLV